MIDHGPKDIHTIPLNTRDIGIKAAYFLESVDAYKLRTAFLALEGLGTYHKLRQKHSESHVTVSLCVGHCSALVKCSLSSVRFHFPHSTSSSSQLPRTLGVTGKAIMVCSKGIALLLL
jgi:hypothetical protein